MNNKEFEALLARLGTVVTDMENANVQKSGTQAAMIKKFNTLVARAEAARPGAGEIL